MSAELSSPEPDRRAAAAAGIIDSLASRAIPVVNLALLATVLISLGSYAAGLAALSDGIRIIWSVLGAVFAAIAIWGVARLRWDLGALRRHRSDLARELFGLRLRDPAAEQTVIEVIEVNTVNGIDGDRGTTRMTIGGLGPGFRTIGRSLGTSGLQGAPWLARLARTTRTGLFGLLRAAVITAFFAVLGLIFLLALAL